MMRIARSLVAVCGLAMPLAGQTAPGPPVITLADKVVTATGLTPSGRVVVFGIVREVLAYEPTFVRRQTVLQADASGRVTYLLPKTVPHQSLWLVADLATGAYAVAFPAGFSVAPFKLPPTALEVRGAGLPDQLLDAADYGEVLLVRAGKGAWGAAVGRGGQNDESLAGKPAARLSLDRLLPIDSSGGSFPEPIGD
ncbi:MAG: hypothetical protein M3O15_06775 [Acidobacteriota bacterium]|nr:hypothetical protein [Acidobacteriota bacterium]